MGMSRIVPPGCKGVGNEVPELRVTYQPKLYSIEGKMSLVSQMWSVTGMYETIYVGGV